MSHQHANGHQRVEVLKSEGSYFRPGQFGFVVGETQRAGCVLMDGGVSRFGDTTYLVAKTSNAAGGALWFSCSAIRFTSRKAIRRLNDER